jgi:DNA-binding XRE family transcriptional regulator
MPLFGKYRGRVFKFQKQNRDGYKLNEKVYIPFDEADEMKKKYADGEITQRELAKKYGVAKRTIYKFVSGDLSKPARNERHKPRTPVDLTGRKSGRLIVISKLPVRQQGHIYWVCECECTPGKKVYIAQDHLTPRFKIRSCGCLSKGYVERMARGSISVNRVHLSDEQVQDIRVRYETGGESQADFAKEYCVNIQTIARIVNNITHVPGRPRQPKRRKLNIVEGIEITPEC